MKQRSQSAGVSRTVPVLAGALASVLATAEMKAAAAVKPPPLPPGSSMVRIQGGLNPDEVKRHKRAHHNKTHHRKDLTRDDSEDRGRGNGNDNGNGKKNDNGRKP